MNMRVLIATDGSEAADRAVDLAAAMDWPTGTELRVATVVERAESSVPAEWLRSDPGHAASDDEVESKARSVLEHAADRLLREGVDVSCRLMHGRPATQVLENAHDFAVDLIIVGSRGHGTIASMLLGSVSAEVADHAHCPVLIARAPYLTRLVLAVDGSSFSRAAEDVVASWAVFKNVAVDVIHVEDVAGGWSAAVALSGLPPSDALQEAINAEVAEHRQICESSAYRLREAGRRASARLVHGSPALELMRSASDLQADLIVLGTHGRTGVERALYGSVARNVMLHAECSVLVVREVTGA